MEAENKELHNAIVELANLRAEYADYKAAMDEVLEKAKSDKIYSSAKLLADTTQLKISNTEERIRGLAVSNYKATGNKKPHPALQIRVNKVFQYATDAVVNWCEKNLQVAVKHTVSVDNKLFEKTITRLDALPDFVVVTEEPKATIATDLSEYTWAGKKTEKDEELPF